MKDYVKNNQQAWDEAYQHAPKSYKEIVNTLKDNPTYYLSDFLVNHLDENDVKDKDIAQFACNNGREILALGLSYGAKSIAGYDLSPTMIQDAIQSAKAFETPSHFQMMDLNDYTETRTFDTLFIMIGVLCWFDDLNTLFDACAKALKPGGKLYLIDGHPFTNVYAFDGEEDFNPDYPYLPVHAYFRKAPFIEHSAMGYVSDVIPKSPFTSYIHTFEYIFEALLKKFTLTTFKESNKNLLGLFPELDKKDLPLVFLIKAQKS